MNREYEADSRSWWCACFGAATALLSTIAFAQGTGQAQSSTTIAELNRAWAGQWYMNPYTEGFSGWRTDWDYHDGKIKTPPNPPPLTPAWQKSYDEIRAQSIAGHNPTDFSSGCVPHGFPTTALWNWQFLFTENSLTILLDAGAYRYIYMDGRAQATDAPLSYHGHSVGHCEGKTLVIDTVAVRENTIMEPGLLHTKDLHAIERLTLTNPDLLTVEYTFIDPKVFSKPWVITKTYTKNKVPDYNEEHECSGNRFVYDEKTGGTIMLDAHGKKLE